jgi:hypothetical protein
MVSGAAHEFAKGSAWFFKTKIFCFGGRIVIPTTHEGTSCRGKKCRDEYEFSYTR